MTEPVKAVAVTDEALRVRVAPTVALKTAWKTTLVAGLTAFGSIVLLILGYLQTVNLAGIVTPERALVVGIIINVAILMLRAFGVKPIVLDNSAAQQSAARDNPTGGGT